MSERFEAEIVRPWTMFDGTVRLWLHDRQLRVHMRTDGAWHPDGDEGSVSTPEDFGVAFPAETLEVIAAAILKWQGRASHADTEARVLREWLAVEQRRVDEALSAGLLGALREPLQPVLDPPRRVPPSEEHR